MRATAAIFSTLFLLISLPFCVTADIPYHRVECDAETRPPATPSYKTCERFLHRLDQLVRKEPKGSYKWYGRHLDDCSECTKLPAFLHFDTLSCAAIVDVSDEDDDALSIFGMVDLYEALRLMVRQCWFGHGVAADKRDGAGYPSGAAFARLVKAPTTELLGLGAEMKWRGRNLTMVDLSKGWIEKVAPNGQIGRLELQEGRTHETA